MTEITLQLAPPLDVSQWFNTQHPLTLEALRGKIVVLHAFQMLCPGCVSHGLPQAQALHERFAKAGIVVIGLHTVFEHHEAMTPVALAAFIHEYRLSFPIGVDRPSQTNSTPATMSAYRMQGTPSLVVIDHNGYICHHAFGRGDDLGVGVLMGGLIAEREQSMLAKATIPAEQVDVNGDCSNGTFSVDN